MLLSSGVLCACVVVVVTSVSSAGCEPSSPEFSDNGGATLLSSETSVAEVVTLSAVLFESCCELSVSPLQAVRQIAPANSRAIIILLILPILLFIQCRVIQCFCFVLIRYNA